MRFSTPEQERGDSFRRQKTMAELYAAQNGLDLVEDSYRDLGVSAFRGANAVTGALRRFLDAVEEGQVPKGSYLLVESLDRVSRNQITAAQGLFLQIVGAGIVLVTLTNGRRYSTESINANPTDLILSILEMMRAHEESEIKARRLKAVWRSKRERASQQKLSSRCPAWLKLREDRTAFDVIEERADIVRLIYAETLKGVGQHKIAQSLNQKGVQTFGRSAYWHRSYIKKILENPAVAGVLLPHETEHVGSRRIRKPCEVVENYFPRVVDQDTFTRVRAMHFRKAPVVGRGSRSVHMLAGLARCPICGGTMTRVNKGSSAKGGHPYLVCAEAKAGAGCQYKSVRVEQVELELRAHASRLAKTAPRKMSALDEMRRDLVARLAKADAEVAKWLKVIDEAGTSSSILSTLRTHEVKRDEIRLALETLAKRVSIVSRSERRAVELASALVDGGQSNQEINALLRQLLEAVVIDWRERKLELRWLHGATTSLPLNLNLKAA
ncbi:MAG: recombinase family protein [Xanthobacteraceae bacterium]|nr:recombinase family protein [Xanthobacteraceae bacterium]